MSQQDRASLDKQRILDMFNCGRKTKGKSAGLSVSKDSRTQELGSSTQKVKRLKTVKERNLMRGQSSSSRNPSHQHSQRSKKHKAAEPQCQDCRCAHFPSLSRKEKPVARPLVVQKPSVITQGRLTSIRGLFSHEVRSVDIERLAKVCEPQEGQSHSSPPLLISEIDLGVISETEDGEPKPAELHSEVECTEISEEQHNCAQVKEHSARPSPREPEPVTLSENKSLTTHPYYDSKMERKQQLSIREPIKKLGATLGKLHDLKNLKENSQVTSNTKSASQISNPPDTEISGDKSQMEPPKIVSTEEAIKRLIARLSQSLGPFPRQRCPAMLTECREVLMRCLQERHGSQLQHNLSKLRLGLCDEESHSTDHTQQAGPSGAQCYRDNTPANYSLTKERQDDQQCRDAQLHADIGLQEQQGVGVYQTVRSEVNHKRKRKHVWESYSPHDSLCNLQQPFQDTLKPWTWKEPSSKSKGPRSSPSFFLHKSQTKAQSLIQCQWPDLTLESTTQKHTQLDNDKSSDPDLSFLISETKPRQTQDYCHHEGQLFGTSVTAPAYFSPDGFCYKPYHLFPQSSNLNSKSGVSGFALQPPSDAKNRSPLMRQHIRYHQFWLYNQSLAP